MAFFDELGKKISQTSQGVVQKTKDTAETLRLNSAVSDEEKRIQMYYKDLGKAYYEAHGNDPQAEFGDIIVGIHQAEDKIKQLKEQLTRLKGVTVCPTCGAEISNQSLFCSVCGNRMAPQRAEEPAQQFCSVCGKALAKDAQFCVGCGTKVATEPVAEAPVVVAEPVVEAPVIPAEPVVEAPVIPAEPVVEAPVIPAEPVVEDPVIPAEPVVEAPVIPVEPVVEAPAAPAANICLSCGKSVPLDYKFCTSCGTPMNQAPQPVQTAPKTCNSCGAPLADGAMFCTNCGTPVAR